jgi:hypothetical protein
MKVTKEFLSEHFQIYNEQIFENKLIVPVFTIYTSRYGPVAMFRINKKNNKPTIKINNSIDWTEKTLVEILIHEMIHQYVVTILKYNGIFSHGWKFLKLRWKIKKKIGIKIPLNGKHLSYKTKKSV